MRDAVRGYRALLTGFTGSIQGDILFTKNINARFRVITGTNSKTFVPESCQERPISPCAISF